MKSVNSFFNPFVPNAPFLYPLKTSKNRNVFCFQEIEKWCIGNKWIKYLTWALYIQYNTLNHQATSPQKSIDF